MTLEEIMKSQGLSDEQIKTITGEMKQNKIFTSTEENIDIRYSKLKGDFDNQGKQLSEANTLIEQFKTGAKDNEKLQGQITAYETQVGELQEQLKQTQLESEIKVALLAAKVQDVDYMTYKLKEKGELELGEDGHIKGIDDKIAGLKTQFPAQFESDSGKGDGKLIDEIKLQKGKEGKEEPKDLADAIKQSYENN